MLIHNQYQNKSFLILKDYQSYIDKSGFFSRLGYGIFTSYWYYKTEDEKRTGVDKNLIANNLANIADQYEK